MANGHFHADTPGNTTPTPPLTSFLHCLRSAVESVAWLVLAAVFKTVETSQGVWWVQFPPSPPFLYLFLQVLRSRAPIGLPNFGMRGLAGATSLTIYVTFTTSPR